jgi:hypothetical protein
MKSPRFLITAMGSDRPAWGPIAAILFSLATCVAGCAGPSSGGPYASGLYGSNKAALRQPAVKDSFPTAREAGIVSRTASE